MPTFLRAEKEQNVEIMTMLWEANKLCILLLNTSDGKIELGCEQYSKMLQKSWKETLERISPIYPYR